MATLNRTTVVGTAAVLALVVLGAMTAIRRGPGDVPDQTPAASAPSGSDQDKDLLLDARTKGSPAAPITIYEVSDFQCPWCRKFWEETQPVLEREYVETGKVRLIFINFPVPQIHPNAEAAHEHAMCAAQQGRFWPMHDRLFSHQDTWAEPGDPGPVLGALADSARVERGALAACLAAGKVRALVAGERQATAQAGVRSTPSFIVNGALLAGHAPIEDWRPILDSIYAVVTRR